MVIKITFFLIFLVINSVNLSNISNKTYKEIELEDYVSNIIYIKYYIHSLLI